MLSLNCDTHTHHVARCYACVVPLMQYDMWHHHQVCAGPNSPVPAMKASIESYIEKGATPGKLILGVSWCATCLPSCIH
jgi:hypothetical protein